MFNKLAFTPSFYYLCKELKTNDAMEKAIDKIKTLLEKAQLNQEKSPNEAAAALRLAQDLMRKHGVSREEITSRGIGEKKSDTSVARRNPPSYLDRLARMVSDLFQCRVYWHVVIRKDIRPNRKGRPTRYTSRKASPVFVGQGANLEVCVYCYENLARMLERARKNYEVPYWVIGKANVGAARNTYCLGWVQAVEEKVKHLIPPAPEESMPNGKGGLVKVNPLDVYLSNKENLRHAGRRTSYGQCRDAYAQGLADGGKVNLNKGVRNQGGRGQKSIE